MTYTRWGKTSCPNSTGAQLVYSGKAGGTKYNSQGGSAETICIPDNPDYIPETAQVTVPWFSTVQGAEYEFFAGPLENHTQYNAPCAVCDVPSRSRAIMIPAKTMCPPSWTREYYDPLHHYKLQWSLVSSIWKWSHTVLCCVYKVKDSWSNIILCCY